jgi:putative flippase GtrA
VRERIVKLWQFSRTPQGRKMVRYAMVSVISALTSVVLITITYGVLRLGSAVACTFVSNILAGIPNYFLNRQWVWKKSGRSHLWREVVPFWALSITGILFALVTASLAQHFCNTHHLQHLARTVVVVGANVAAFGILWVLKFLVFNRLFAEIADKELGAEADGDDDADADADAQAEAEA